MSAANVQWLFDELDAARTIGTLLTVQTIIKLEVESGEQYTKDAALMQRLRQCWKTNEARIAREASEREDE